AEPGGHLVAITRSGRRGQFRFPSLAPGKYNLHATARSFRPRLMVLHLHRGIERVTVRLTHLRTLSAVVGRVVGTDGEPLSVPVTAVLRRETEVDLRRQRVATDGEFAFDHLHPGSYQVTALAEGYAPATAKFMAIAGTVSSIDLRIRPSTRPRDSQNLEEMVS
ncbi:hypothetical protein B1A_21085, partial [mine drainage metagenome]